MEVAAAALDQPEEEAEKKDGDASMGEPASPRASQDKRGLSGVGGAPPQTKALKTKEVTSRSSSNWPDDTLNWDLGGAGDCGFRALAAARAVRKAGTAKIPEIQQKIAKMAVTLRTRCIIELKKKASFKQGWYVDPEAIQRTEARDIPQTWDDCLVACERPAKWMDPWLTEAAATALESEMFVWKRRKDGWNFVVRISPP